VKGYLLLYFIDSRSHYSKNGCVFSLDRDENTSSLVACWGPDISRFDDGQSPPPCRCFPLSRWLHAARIRDMDSHDMARGNASTSTTSAPTTLTSRCKQAGTTRLNRLRTITRVQKETSIGRTIK